MGRGWGCVEGGRGEGGGRSTRHLARGAGSIGTSTRVAKSEDDCWAYVYHASLDAESK